MKRAEDSKNKVRSSIWIDEELWKWVRIAAAKEDRSISNFITTVLQEKKEREKQ